MPRPFLPTRGVFVPACLIYNRAFPAVLLHTWIQLRGLTWGDLETPTLSLKQLADLTGKSRACIYGHLTSLRLWGALRWRPSERGTLIVSFDANDEVAISPPGSLALESRNLDKPDLSLRDQHFLSGEDLVKEGGSADSRILDSLDHSQIKQIRQSEDLAREGGSGESRNLDRPEQDGGQPAPRDAIPEAAVSRAPPGASGKKSAAGGKPPRQKVRSPAVRLYQALTSRPLNRTQRELLNTQVTDPERWKATLGHWLAHGWSLKNIAGQLELYHRGGPAACRFCQKEAAPEESTLDTIQQMLKELTDFE